MGLICIPVAMSLGVRSVRQMGQLDIRLSRFRRVKGPGHGVLPRQISRPPQSLVGCLGFVDSALGYAE